MAIKSGKTTVLASQPGVVPSKIVTLAGMTTSGSVTVSSTQRTDITDTRGAMQFYAVAGTGQFTIYGKDTELHSNTEIAYAADTDGSGSDVVGLLDLKGDLDASTNPNYPIGVKGDSYIITVAGKVGGASGKIVKIGDLVVCKADAAAGTEAAVGTSWFVLEKNITDTDDVPEGSVNEYYTDAKVTASTHASDATIHFTEGSIDHTAITNIGTNSHSDIDTHIGTLSIHTKLNYGGTPIASNVGELWYDSDTTALLYIWTGAVWAPL